MAVECDRVVEQHQRWQKPEEGDVPEFTIEVAYKSETLTRGGTLAEPGWRYIIKWQENGQAKAARQYNFDSKEAAIRVAKREADQIARSLLPVHVETYTPEV